MGLFDKKYCDICGEKIGLLGNRKLKDGNLCKDCAAKLSPWFSDRRESTVQEIREQLAYREANQEKAAAFTTTWTYGSGSYKLYLDETKGEFLITSSKDFAKANPDVLTFDQITGVEVIPEEHKTEVKRKDSEGKEVSFDPKRYSYSYDCDILVRVNHPYFDDMRFQINGSSVEVGQPTYIANVAQEIRPEQNADYQKLLNTAEEIRQALVSGHKVIIEQQVAAAPVPPEPSYVTAPQPVKIQVICPYCGATTLPNDKGCCEYCGSKLV